MKDMRTTFYVFIFVFFTRTPAIYLVLTNSWHEPGDDGIHYIVTALNLLDGNGYTTDYLYHFHQYSDNELGRNLFYHYPPFYSIFLSQILWINELFFGVEAIEAIVIANVIIYSSTVALIYHYFLKNYPSRISNPSIVLLAFNPMFYAYSTSILSEIFFVFFCTLSFALWIKMNLEPSVRNIIFLSIATALATMIRYPGGLLFVSIVAFHIIKREYKVSINYTISYALLLTPWIIICFLEYGDPIPRLNNGFFHPMYSSSLTPAYNFSGQFLLSARIFLQIIYWISSTTTFLFLFPFSLLFFFKNQKNTSVQFITLYLIISLGFHIMGIGGDDIPRYLIFFLLLGLTVSLIELEKFCSITSQKISLHSTFEFDFYTLLTFILLVSVISMSLTNSVVNRYDYYSGNEENYTWFNENVMDDVVVCATESHRTYYFTGQVSVKLPSNIYNNDSFSRFISDYNCSFLVIESAGKNHYEADIVSTFFIFDKDVGYYLVIGDYSFRIVYFNTSFENKITVYRIEESNASFS